MRRLLRFLSSLWLGISLIALFAIACIGGSLIASHEGMGVDHAREYVFHTPWFLGLMGLLLVNLCLCSWEKSYIALTLYKKKNAIAQKAFYEKAKHAVAIDWRGSLDQLHALLRKRYTVVYRRGDAFYAQKGLFGRTGATIIHIGLLWTMMAGYYRILADDFEWGVFDSTVVLPEGQTTASFYSRIDRLKGSTEDNLYERTMPFSLRALDFRADFFPHSTVARRFSSLVELRDGDHAQINEVTMTDPLLYKGYKITQNSYGEHPRVRRGQYRIVDTRTGRSSEVDTVPGDPVKLHLPKTDDLFLQVDARGPESQYQIVDLANRQVVQQGRLRDAAPTSVPALTPEALEAALKTSRYSFLVAALFPNFQFDENNQPTTLNEKFDNPAVFVMLFKNGEANGQLWLFHDKQAQDIIGQPHPEVTVTFTGYRLKPGVTGGAGLQDYEVNLKFEQKDPTKLLGDFWVTPGELNEVPKIDSSIIGQPNVKTMEVDHSTTGSSGLDPLDTVTTTTLDTAGGAGPVESAAGGTTTAASIEDASVKPKTTGRYRVLYLGEKPGQVTYLGFMKDPSVGWLFTGCLIIIAGTITAFIVVYREVWAYYEPEEGRLYMATLVRGTSPAAHREFEETIKYAAELSPRLEPMSAQV